jgi:hypothetical protein
MEMEGTGDRYDAISRDVAYGERGEMTILPAG